MIFQRLSLPLFLLVGLGLNISYNNTIHCSTIGDIKVIHSKEVSWRDMLTDSVGIPAPAIELALNGFTRLSQQNQLRNDSLLTIIDFSKPSVEKRLYILDIKNERVVKNTLVAHGVNSGMDNAENFSNTINSNKSSLGLYVTRNTYQGKHGYSLRIDGMNEGLNDNALRRAVVIHGADYVSEDFIRRNGRIGRSFGCPAIPFEDNKAVIDLIKDGSCVFIYHPALNLTAQLNPEKL